MRKLLVAGGTVFVSRYIANYFAQRGDDVYVLSRNSKPQLPNVTLIERDRNDLGDNLKGYEFDAVLDITVYTREHTEKLVNTLIPDVKPLAEGPKESLEWFCQDRDAVMRRPYWEYINQNLCESD